MDYHVATFTLLLKVTVGFKGIPCAEKKAHQISDPISQAALSESTTGATKIGYRDQSKQFNFSSY
jgi:hypothetical protein